MAKVFKPYRKESKINWGTTVEENVPLDNDQIQLGALLRIADSLENMEQPFKKLLEDVEFYRNSARALSDRNESLKRRVAALQGVITKMKKAKR